MSDEVHTEWHNSPDFAEAAEALGINTIDVMAMLPDEIVLFTPYPREDDPRIFKARLGRDADGILRAGPWHYVTRTSEFQDRIEDLIRKAMEERDDERYT